MLAESISRTLVLLPRLAPFGLVLLAPHAAHFAYGKLPGVEIGEVQSLVRLFLMAVSWALFGSLVTSFSAAHGTGASTAEVFRHAVKFSGRVCAGALTVICSMLLLFLSASVVARTIGMLLGGGMSAIPLFVASLLLTVWVFAGLSLTIPTIVLGGASSLGSVERSWSMTRGLRGSISVAYVVLSAVGLAGVWLAEIPVRFQDLPTEKIAWYPAYYGVLALVHQLVAYSLTFVFAERMFAAVVSARELVDVDVSS